MTPDDIRKIVLKSLFSTDELIDVLTLKGGNALKLLGITERQSQDLDFSIKKDIRFNETEDSYLFQNALNKGFEEEGYVVNNDYSALSGPPLQQGESFDSHFESTSPHIRSI